MHYLVSIYWFKFFQFSVCYWFLDSFHCDQKRYLYDFNLWNLLRIVLWPNIWPVLDRVFCVHWRACVFSSLLLGRRSWNFVITRNRLGFLTWTSSQNMSVVYQLGSSTKNQILLFLSADVKWNIKIYYLDCLLFKRTHHPRDHSTNSISHNSSNYWKSPLTAILFNWNTILSYFPFNALWKFAHTAKEGHSFRKYWAHLS